MVGVVSNNPSFLALMQIISDRNIDSERFALEDIVMLNIGTGRNNKFIDQNPLRYGTLEWISPLINILMDASDNVVNYSCDQLIGERYLTIEAILDIQNVIEMDNETKFNDMLNIANNLDLSEYVEWLKEYWI